VLFRSQKAYDAGKISFEQFSTAVSGVEQAFGLATPASQALALGIQGLVLGLEGGQLPAVNFDDALSAVIKDSEDGKIDIDNLMGSFATVEPKMTPANAAFEDAAQQLANLNLKVSGLNTTISGFDWNALGQSVGQGLADGMIASIPEVSAAAAALAQAAALELSSNLEMKSPSQVMFELGELATQGFVGGMTSDLFGGIESSLGGIFAGVSGGGGSSSISDSYNESWTVYAENDNALEILLERQRLNNRQARAEELM